MLGSSILHLLREEYEVVGLTRTSFSLEHHASTIDGFRQLAPDIIIHCAAYTNVEAAESNVQECYTTNYLTTLNIANYCQKHNCKLIYISSTGCYGVHSNSPYTEYDSVQPTTIYHKSKLAGENAVISLCQDFLVLRTGWLFGGDVTHQKNFVINRIKEANSKDKIVSDPFQFGNPTYVNDVAKQIDVLIRAGISGVFNVVSEGVCTRYDYVKAILERMKMKTVVVRSEIPFLRKALVSNNESAVNYSLKNIGLCVMRPWEEALEDYIQQNSLGLDYSQISGS
jgi:dTDP-4-dehydrorhamnose reductase